MSSSAADDLAVCHHPTARNQGSVALATFDGALGTATAIRRSLT
jgi:hypothetical protein